MKRTMLIQGLKAGIPIALGYIPIAIAFGILSRAEEIPIEVSMLMSLTVFAGASQFVAVNLLSLGTGIGEVIVTTFILNFRHFLMSASLFQRIEKNLTMKKLSVLSFGITDETFSLASVTELDHEERLPFNYLFGLMLISFFAWNVGTWIGLFMGNILPTLIQNSMGIALYAMFIGLLVPAVRKSIPLLFVALIAMTAHSLLILLPFLPSLSSGWNVVIATILASFIGTLIIEKEAFQ